MSHNHERQNSKGSIFHNKGLSRSKSATDFFPAAQGPIVHVKCMDTHILLLIVIFSNSILSLAIFFQNLAWPMFIRKIL